MKTAILSTGKASALPLVPEHRGAPRLILIVDDDARTRRLVRAVVALAMVSADSVADVIEAEDFSDAHCSARRAGRSVDLLITDIRLGPGKSGVELARDLSSMSPRMQVLLMSGTDSMSGTDVRDRQLPKEWHFLAKPFRVSDVVELVKALT